MNLYEMEYTKQWTDEPKSKVRKYQIPATTEQQALIILGQMFGEQPEPPYKNCEVTLLSVKKVG